MGGEPSNNLGGDPGSHLPYGEEKRYAGQQNLEDRRSKLTEALNARPGEEHLQALIDQHNGERWTKSVKFDL